MFKSDIPLVQMKHMALCQYWLQYHTENTSIFVRFYCFKQPMGFGHFILDAEWDEYIKQSALILLCCPYLIFLQETPASKFREIRRESLLSLHYTFVVFLTGLEFQCRTRHCETVSTTRRKHTSLIFLLKCCSATSRTCTHWPILAMRLWWGKVMVNL